MKQITDQSHKPPVPEILLPDCLKWISRNTSRNYYNALWATLIHLKPKHCLEIGTYMYYSAKIFSYYFQTYMPDGVLITCDVSEWNRDKEPPPNVYPLMVYPHRNDIEQFHGGINIYHKNYKQVLSGKSDASIINSIIINEEMTKFDINMFDLTFVDAGHDKVSALADLYIAKNMTKPNGWILIDDITNNDHDLKDIYPLIRNDNFYEYTNWDNYRNVDMALVKCRKFKCQ